MLAAASDPVPRTARGGEAVESSAPARVRRQANDSNYAPAVRRRMVETASAHLTEADVLALGADGQHVAGSRPRRRLRPRGRCAATRVAGATRRPPRPNRSAPVRGRPRPRPRGRRFSAGARGRRAAIPPGWPGPAPAARVRRAGRPPAGKQRRAARFADGSAPERGATTLDRRGSPPLTEPCHGCAAAAASGPGAWRRMPRPHAARMLLRSIEPVALRSV